MHVGAKDAVYTVLVSRSRSADVATRGVVEVGAGLRVVSAALSISVLTYRMHEYVDARETTSCGYSIV
jgi:hypothetical protein